MNCTVIICTSNQCRKLVNVLRSLQAMTLPRGLSWELLVVDNDSDDDTAAVVAQFADVLPVTRVWEPIAGLSNARNTGVRHAKERYVVWTDDDVNVGQNWLAAYCKAFESHPEAALFAVRITPVLELPTPAWFRDSVADLHYLLATRDFGPVPAPLSVAVERLPFGASFAVRLAEQQRFPFDPDLGVAPARRRCSEETAVAEAILGSGSSGWWMPGAEVQHIIAPDRQTTAYIAQFIRSMGEAWARTTKASSISTRIKVAAGTLRFAAARTTGHRAWVRYLASLSFHRGALAWFQEHRH